MGDAGEGLIDADARIQERMEELEQERKAARGGAKHENPEQVRVLEGLRLARLELEGRLKAATNDRYRAQIEQAMADVDQRIKTTQAGTAAPAGR